METETNVRLLLHFGCNCVIISNKYMNLRQSRARSSAICGKIMQNIRGLPLGVKAEVCNLSDP